MSNGQWVMVNKTSHKPIGSFSTSDLKIHPVANPQMLNDSQAIEVGRQEGSSRTDVEGMRLSLDQLTLEQGPASKAPQLPSSVTYNSVGDRVIASLPPPSPAQSAVAATDSKKVAAAVAAAAEVAAFASLPNTVRSR